MVWPILISVSVAPTSNFLSAANEALAAKVAIAPATAANLKRMVFSLFEKSLFAATSAERSGFGNRTICLGNQSRGTVPANSRTSPRQANRGRCKVDARRVSDGSLHRREQWQAENAIG